MLRGCRRPVSSPGPQAAHQGHGKVVISKQRHGQYRRVGNACTRSDPATRGLRVVWVQENLDLEPGRGYQVVGEPVGSPPGSAAGQRATAMVSAASQA